MNRNYIYLTVLMMVLAFGTFFLKRTDTPKEIDPDELLREIIQPTRFISTDQLAEMIIQGDPSLQIVDVRKEIEFEDFSLPKSINIPLDSLLNEGNMDYFGIPGVNLVFVSNDDIKADQAWVLIKRLGYNRMYVLKGGLNKWMETIINPKQPDENASLAELENYQFRIGARLYFTGTKIENNASSKTKVTVKRRKKTVVASGGC